MANPEECRLSLHNFRAYGNMLSIRAEDLPPPRALAVAAKWARRQQYPPDVSKLDQSMEAISRLAGINDEIEVGPAWQLSRRVGAFVVATEYAGQILDVARGKGYEVYGIVMGYDHDAGLYLAAPFAEMPDIQSLKDVVDGTNEQLSVIGVQPLPLPPSLMLTRAQS